LAFCHFEKILLAITTADRSLMLSFSAFVVVADEILSG
jgi:hypothetical protein